MAGTRTGTRPVSAPALAPPLLPSLLVGASPVGVGLGAVELPDQGPCSPKPRTPNAEYPLLPLPCCRRCVGHRRLENPVRAAAAAAGAHPRWTRTTSCCS